jgi:hypothetical protein
MALPGPTTTGQIATDLAMGIDKLGGVLWNTTLAMALVGFITVFAVQLLKPVVRALVLTNALSAWLRTRSYRMISPSDLVEEGPQWGEWSKWAGEWNEWSRRHHYYSGRQHNFNIPSIEIFNVMPFVPRDLYMKELQNRVQQVLERPSDNPYAFLAVTKGAARFDQAVVLISDYLIRQAPLALFEAENLFERTQKDEMSEEGVTKTTGYSTTISMAQDHVAAASERNLDNLQIRLAVQWPVIIRLLSLVTGVLIAYFGGLMVAGLSAHLWWFLLIIGAIGSYIASIIYDAFAIVGRLRPR